MQIKDYLVDAAKKRVSDIFIIAGKPLVFKLNGEMTLNGSPLSPSETHTMIEEIYGMAHRADHLAFVEESGDDDFSFSIPGVARFRVNVYKQRGSLSAVIRIVLFEDPDPDLLHIPKAVMDLSTKNGGLILVTGPAGSGKSTTLACLIDKINRERDAHIMTLEDPIEFLHRHKKGLVSQREVSLDTESYLKGLRAALRQAPDVILVGEMRDAETINVAMTAAETGQLVLSTLHTLGAANSIDRIIDVFPPQQQHQIRMQLSMVLQGVISQQLIPCTKGGRVAAFEIMLASNAVKNLIRESKIHQLDSIIYSSADKGMQTMDTCIRNLYNEGQITKEDAILYSVNRDAMASL